MHVLMAIAEMGSGGAETLVAELTGALSRDGHDVSLASNGGWREERLRTERGVTSLVVPLRDPGALSLGRSAARIARHARRARVDVVHAHNVRASVAARLGTSGWPGRRPPLVTTVHGLAPADYPRAARALRWSADLVVAVSDSVRADLVGAGFPPERLHVIENAVPVGEHPRRDEARTTLGLPEAAPVVLCVARLAPPKRHDLLLEAWAGLDDRTAILLVAGAGPDAERLHAQADRLGLAHRVRFLGTRTDVARLHAAADLVVLPSDREGLPMAVLEALAAGVPVVASDVGGLRDLGRAATLVAPGSAPALAAALAALLTDPVLRARQAAAGRALVLDRFAAAPMRAAYLSTYDQVRHIREGGAV